MLIAADRSDRSTWAEHRARLELGILPITTAPVVAHVSRSGRQPQLRRFLRGCDVLPFAADQAHDVGALLGLARSVDVTDAHLVLTARDRDATVFTSDYVDLTALAGHLSPRPRVVRI